MRRPHTHLFPSPATPRCPFAPNLRGLSAGHLTESISRAEDESAKSGPSAPEGQSQKPGTRRAGADDSHELARASRGQQGAAAARKLQRMLSSYKSKHTFPPLSLDVPLRERLEREPQEGAIPGARTRSPRPKPAFARCPKPPEADLGSPRATPSPARARMLGPAATQMSAKLEALLSQESVDGRASRS